MYLSLWAAFQVYSLIPSSVAFVMMVAVTAATAAMAWAQDAQILAAFALTGGFSTPLLLSTGQNREIALFAYVAILDLGTLALVSLKPWRRLLVMSYAGTLLLYVGWYSRFYNRSQLNLTLAFATLFFAIFAIAPLITLQPEGEMPLLRLHSGHRGICECRRLFPAGLRHDRGGRQDLHGVVRARVWRRSTSFSAARFSAARFTAGRGTALRRDYICSTSPSPSASSPSQFPFDSTRTGLPSAGLSRPECCCGWPIASSPIF